MFPRGHHFVTSAEHRCRQKEFRIIWSARNCGKIQPDPRSRFCDRCGVPVIPPVQPLPPADPAMQAKACPRCGFKNSGPSLFFCKKCGSSLEGGEPPENCNGTKSSRKGRHGSLPAEGMPCRRDPGKVLQERLLCPDNTRKHRQNVSDRTGRWRLVSRRSSSSSQLLRACFS